MPHAVQSSASKVALYEPGAQGFGAIEPVAHELPGKHVEHCDSDARLKALLNLPFLHDCAAAAPDLQKVPGEQLVHAVPFGLPWNLPASQALQADCPSTAA